MSLADIVRGLGRQVLLRMVAPDPPRSARRIPTAIPIRSAIRTGRRSSSPPYPDWPSGLSGIIGAISTALTLVDGGVDLFITSAAAGMTRHYTSASASIQQDVIDARVWSGIHFRTADVVGVAMGTQVANWALGHHFAPGK